MLILQFEGLSVAGRTHDLYFLYFYVFFIFQLTISIFFYFDLSAGNFVNPYRIILILGKRGITVPPTTRRQERST